MAGTRVRTLTEKGISLYESMFDDHNRQVQKKKRILEKYLDSKNLPFMKINELTEFRDSLVLSMTDYENSVSSFRNFLSRNRSENGDRERSSLELIYVCVQGQYQTILMEVDTLISETPTDVTSKPQVARSIKTEVSRRSSNPSRHTRSSKSSGKLSVLSMKQRAEMEAMKVKLKAAVKEADILQKQAALQADLGILAAQREFEEAKAKHKVFMEELGDIDRMSDLSDELDKEVSDRTSQYVEDQNKRLAANISESLPISTSLPGVGHIVPSYSTAEFPLQTTTVSEPLGPLPSSSLALTHAVTSATMDPVPKTPSAIGISLQQQDVKPSLMLQHETPITSHSFASNLTATVFHDAPLRSQLPEEALPIMPVPTPIGKSRTTSFVHAPASTISFGCPLGTPSYNLPEKVERPRAPMTQSINSQPTSTAARLSFPDTSVRAPRTGVGTTLNPHAPAYMPAASLNSETQAFTNFLLKKELLFSRLTKFHDTPETYIMWKSSFKSIMSDLAVTPMEEMDLLVKWLGPESSRQASSLRTSNPLNPGRGVRLIWERLDQRYGSPEVIEDALKRKLSSFAKLTKFDTSKFYDLLDILSEVDANMQNSNYKDLLSYYNSSSGIIPIVNKLPQGVQEKWTTRAHKYKQDHHVPYPPFTYFIDFVSDITRMKNDPGFLYDREQLPAKVRLKPQQGQRGSRPPMNQLTVHKTEVGNTDTKQPSCPLHHTKHKLNKCREFRKMSVDDRKRFLRKNSICFKCCGLERHSFKDCNATVRCEVCKSTRHPTALHVDTQSEESSTRQGGEQTTAESSLVTALCNQVCSNPAGFSKSCAKTVLVKVYPADRPESALKLYAIIDDQSNQSLAKSALFDHLGARGDYVEYSLSSCSGVMSTAGRKASGLMVEAIDGSVSLPLPTLFECNQIPDARHEIPVPEAALYHPHLRDLADCIPPLDPNADILLLIGRDLPAAHHVQDQKIGPMDGPIGQHLNLGWVIIGEVCLGNIHRPHVTTNKTHILANGRPTVLLPCPNCFEFTQDEPLSDFPIYARTSQDDKPGLSIDDKEFLQIMESNLVKDSSGNWEAPLPFKSDRPRLPNNRSQAVRRALSLDASLRKDSKKRSHMIEFMGKILSKGHAEVAPKLQEGEECWYLPLFGIYHPKKPEKIRGVFDSSAKQNGLSLNSVLLTGPDIVNSLLGVLLRFRKDSIAVTADVEQMFYCFKVAERHRNFLRFLWYQDNDLQNPLIEFRMTSHVFGNSPSPAVATYGFRKAVEGASKDVHDFVTRNFYVDDGLTSTPTAESAVSLVTRAQKTLMENGNIRLHKVASNSQDVLKSLDQDDLAGDIKNLNLQSDPPPLQRSLGLYWNLAGDYFTFSSDAQNKPYTKRGLLATTNSLFDPIGFAAPVVLKGRLLFRDLVTSTSDWDEPLSEEHRAEWESWCESLHQLSSCQIPRQYVAGTVFDDGDKEIHIFSDASKDAISAVAYLRRKTDAQYQTSFLFGKAKVAPQHGHTIPRLELCAAVLATEIGRIVSEQLDIPTDRLYFYSDNRIVLGYLRNRVRRFYVYVGNRVDRITRFSQPTQWSHVSTDQNPADEGTRSIPAPDLQNSMWLQGPSFLRNEIPVSSEPTDDYPLIEPDKDSEVRPVVNVMKVSAGLGTTLNSKHFKNFSTWKSLTRGVAKLTSMINARKRKDHAKILRPINAEDLKDSQLFILREVQHSTYAKEIRRLKESKSLPRDSSILNLSPYLDSEGLLRVGGRLNRSGYNVSEKNPIIMSGKHHVSMLLVLHYHSEVRHQGRHFTDGAVRSAGFWITGAKRLVSGILHHCIQCRKLRGKFSFQQMADLPTDRLKPCPPFTSVGVDVFGPWNVVSRRTRGGLSNSKRWAVLFTCLASRAVQIEVIDEMSTSTFINALRRFRSIRGPVKEFRSDRGTNFVGCTGELGIQAINIEESQMTNYLRNSQSVWIFNPPHASHMGGVWERQIGTARRILDSMLLDMRGKSLTHDVLTTLMCEVSAIMNSRPLANVSTDPEAPEILSASTLLTQKPASAWISNFSHLDVKDLYRHQWKCVQVLAEEFWTKWKKEYIMSLQQRRKWCESQPNLKPGDIVLLKDASVSRMEWPLGLITRVFPSDDGLVRKVEVKVSKSYKSSIYVRPINELVFLLSTV